MTAATPTRFIGTRAPRKEDPKLIRGRGVFTDDVSLPGMVMAAVGLLSENPKPTEREVREGLEGNLCRCTGYHNIVRAVIAASGQDPDEVQGAAIHRVTDAGGVEAAAGFSSGDSAGGGE